MKLFQKISKKITPRINLITKESDNKSFDKSLTKDQFPDIKWKINYITSKDILNKNCKNQKKEYGGKMPPKNKIYNLDSDYIEIHYVINTISFLIIGIIPDHRDHS